MPRVQFLNAIPHGAQGGLEMHYGYVCEVGEGRTLFGEVPEEMLAGEVAAGRVVPVKAPRQKKIEAE